MHLDNLCSISCNLNSNSVSQLVAHMTLKQMCPSRGELRWEHSRLCSSESSGSWETSRTGESCCTGSNVPFFHRKQPNTVRNKAGKLLLLR